VGFVVAVAQEISRGGHGNSVTRGREIFPESGRARVCPLCWWLLARTGRIGLICEVRAGQARARKGAGGSGVAGVAVVPACFLVAAGSRGRSAEWCRRGTCAARSGSAKAGSRPAGDGAAAQVPPWLPHAGRRKHRRASRWRPTRLPPLWPRLCPWASECCAQPSEPLVRTRRRAAARS
jgi:hypothetical protein